MILRDVYRVPYAGTDMMVEWLQLASLAVDAPRYTMTATLVLLPASQASDASCKC